MCTTSMYPPTIFLICSRVGSPSKKSRCSTAPEERIMVAAIESTLHLHISTVAQLDVVLSPAEPQSSAVHFEAIGAHDSPWPALRYSVHELYLDRLFADVTVRHCASPVSGHFISPLSSLRDIASRG